MTHYTIEELIAMNNEALAKAAKHAFSIQFDPFSELGKRAIKRRLGEVNWVRPSGRVSPAIKTIVGAPALLMEAILDYQDALAAGALKSAS